MRQLLYAIALALPLPLSAQTAPEIVEEVLSRHVLPGYADLVEETQSLAMVAETHCAPGDAALQDAFGSAFDAWIRVSHLTFGPAEEDNRLFALAFWPDGRGMTPRSLTALIEGADPVVEVAEAFATVSIAARGFYALEVLLYDDTVSTMGDAAYRCALVQAITGDIAATAGAIRDDWETRFADLMRNAGDNDRFQTPEEALRLFFSALNQGLEFTADLRLGRPLGSFDDPRPQRAEARRSDRSLRHVVLSVESLGQLAGVLAQADPELQADLAQAVETALDRAATLDDPALAGVATPQGRIRIEALQQRVREIRDLVQQRLGPELGVAAGFNALDGD